MKKEDLLSKEFLKQFKDSKEFGSFIDDIYMRCIEAMLDGELDAHLGYLKNQNRPDWINNARNGYGSKELKTEHGSIRIDVPRDRNASFEPQIVPKRSGLYSCIENLVISLYAKGMRNSDIEEQLKEINDFRPSPSVISKITDITNHHRYVLREK